MVAAPNVDASQAGVINAKLDAVRDSVKKLEGGLDRVNDTLTVLVRVEQIQIEHGASLGRAFKVLENHEERVQKIETKLPALTEVRNWVIAGVLAVASAGLWVSVSNHQVLQVLSK